MFFWSNQHIGVAMIPTSVQILYTVHQLYWFLILLHSHIDCIDSWFFWLDWFLHTCDIRNTIHNALFVASGLIFIAFSHCIDYIDICAHLEHNTQCKWTSSSIMIISTIALNFYFVEDPLMEMWHFKWMSLFYFHVYVLYIFYLYIYLYLYEYANSQLHQRTILYFYVSKFSVVREFSHILPHKPYIFLKFFLLYIEMSLALFVWYCWHRFPLVHSSGNPVMVKRQLQMVSGVLRSDQRVPVSVLVHLGKIVLHLLLIIGILRFFWDAHIYLGLISTSTAWWLLGRWPRWDQFGISWWIVSDRLVITLVSMGKWVSSFVHWQLGVMLELFWF